MWQSRFSWFLCSPTLRASLQRRRRRHRHTERIHQTLRFHLCEARSIPQEEANDCPTAAEKSKADKKIPKDAGAGDKKKKSLPLPNSLALEIF
ncbi:hypothetical protein HAX54_017059 [Datura stramonium]|uniref:Uncharacterized protein n=1 Tax=Datura stramonium TaxID=4076 RepID=A0ABS8UM88_DATST|nr:hypothetical protein [Datura stramonium]